MPKPKSKPAGLYALLGILFVVAIGYQARASWEQGPVPVNSPFGVEPGTRRLSDVHKAAVQAGLRSGDELLAVNGVEFRGTSVLMRALAGARPGDSVSLRIRRGVEELDIAVPLAAPPPVLSRLETRLISGVLFLAMPWVSLLLGFWVTLVRPRDSQGWLLLLLMLSFPHLVTFDQRHWSDWIRVPGLVYHAMMRSLIPAAMVLFGFYFIVRFPLDRKLPWLKWLLLAPSILFALLNPLFAVLHSENYQAAAALVGFYRRTGNLQGALMFVSIGLFFASIGWKMGVTPPGDAKRRLKLMLWGTQVAMAPMFVVVLGILFTRQQTFDLVPTWVLTAALMLMFLFPLTLAYVILVHRALDTRVVVRQGIQYALARGGARVLVVLVAVLILFSALMLATSEQVNRPRQITLIAVGILLLLAVVRLGRRLALWIDRRFFREAYDAERILTELSEEVRLMVDARALLETVCRRISESLYVPRVAFLLAEGAHYRPAYALGYADAPAVEFSAEAGTVRRLTLSNEPARVHLDDENSWIYDELPQQERDLLARLETQLVLPLAVREKLLGFISLGRKKSEEPYSGSDLRLLRSLASQTGLALENSRLTSAIAAEAAQRERINRELEIAREVQERLFPQQLPRVEGLDFAGGCRPALGVGGDYYDFLLLPDDRLGIAVGDVSGKGIAAALLMSGLQASVRGQALHPEQNLAAIITHVNKLLYDSSASSRYATLFYAQMDLKTRRLDYVNAGHNAPMLLRRAGADIEIRRLTVGGPVVGLLPRCPYQQASVDLLPGDLLVCYTDGISEAMNHADEEWGEEKLAEAARECFTRPASESIQFLMQQADAFTAGAEQHDDMTLVILRVQR